MSHFTFDSDELGRVHEWNQFLQENALNKGVQAKSGDGDQGEAIDGDEGVLQKWVVWLGLNRKYGVA